MILSNVSSIRQTNYDVYEIEKKITLILSQKGNLEHIGMRTNIHSNVHVFYFWFIGSFTRILSSHAKSLLSRKIMSFLVPVDFQLLNF